MTDLPAAEHAAGDYSLNTATKKKQYIILGSVGGLVALGMGYFLYQTTFSPTGPAVQDNPKRYQATVNAAQSPVADTTAESLSSQVRAQKDIAQKATTDNETLKQQVNQLQTQLQTDHADAQRTVSALQRQVETRENADARTPVVVGAPALGAAGGAAQASSAAPSLLPGGRNPYAPTSGPLVDGLGGDAGEPAPHRTMSVIKASYAQQGGPAGAGQGGAAGPGSLGGGPGGPSVMGGSPGASAMGGGQPGLMGSKTYFSSSLEVYDSAKYVPPNAYAEAKVLVGVDAATGTTYAADPKPVLFRVIGPAVHVGTNGRFQTTDLTGCMVNGAAFGELPSEKVYIKLQKITCPAGQGKFAVATVEGYVSSKGKAGVRGQVISREGQFTGRALIAGALNGLGQALSTNVQRSQSGLNTDPTGVGGLLATRELSPAQIASGSIGTGVSNASSMLADYYIKRAEQYQPVIEMPTGISVEIVFLSGFQVR